jgi:PD-(D/E)XK nuclease family transposase
MRPIFADPKTDLIFKRIFGSEPHKHLLVELLNTLLELEGDRRIRNLTYLPAEQTVTLPEMKLSIVAVKCVDQRGAEYVVEMQLFNVKGFEERVVYNASKAFVRLATARVASGSDQERAPLAPLTTPAKPADPGARIRTAVNSWSTARSRRRRRRRGSPWRGRARGAGDCARPRSGPPATPCGDRVADQILR